jgi:type II secretory pathway pseudopilin PulG
MGSSPYPQEPPKKGGKTWIIALVVGCVAIPIGIAVLGIIAAIAIPSFLRARISANESQNIGDIRALISAEVVYQSQSGRFGTPECLHAPSTCIKGYSGAAFVDTAALAMERSGYRRTFELSPDGESFTYVVEPMKAGQTGVRSFCGDSTGIICETKGARPSTSRGRCEVDATCTPL